MRRIALTSLTAVLLTSTLGCGDDGAADQDGTATDASSSGSPTTTPDPTTTSVDPDTTGAPTMTDATADSSGTESSTTDDPTGESSSDTGEENVAVTISFSASIGGEPFACGTTYSGFGSTEVDVTPQDLRFFVQDLHLVRADDGTEVAVTLDILSPWQAETVALVDFEDGAGECEEAGGNEETRTIITGTVPAGDYDGVVFTVGVPEDLNHQDPLTLPLPLEAGTMTWGWLFGYKFTKFEIVQVVDEGEPGIAMLHLGSTGCTGMPGVGDITCALPNRARVVLADFDHAVDTVGIDLGAVFGGLDLTQDIQCHSFQGDTCPPMFDVVGVDHSTGAPTDAQALFAVVK